jgi:hypothetical protein
MTAFDKHLSIYLSAERPRVISKEDLLNFEVFKRWLKVAASRATLLRLVAFACLLLSFASVLEGSYANAFAFFLPSLLCSGALVGSTELRLATYLKYSVDHSSLNQDVLFLKDNDQDRLYFVWCCFLAKSVLPYSKFAKIIFVK